MKQKRSRWRIGLALLVGLIAACEGAPGRQEHVAASSSALKEVGIRPVPAKNGVPVWDGSAVDLLIADAMATCIPPEGVDEDLFPKEDEYLSTVLDHMAKAACYGGPITMDVWRQQRADPSCNIIEGTDGGTGKCQRL